MLLVDFVTLFPDWIRGSLEQSIMNRAAQAGHVRFRTANPRDYCYDQHRKVDDVPYGGHAGMLLRAEPVALAIEELAVAERRAVVVVEPSGVPFSQVLAAELGSFEQVTLVCGHYEGIDHRVEESFATHVVSIGDYVLTNGELPALVIADAIVRLLPGVLGSADSLASDSFGNGLLSAPNYTRPEVWRGMAVPEVLKSGDHKKIERWQREQSEQRTRERRPDLMQES